MSNKNFERYILSPIATIVFTIAYHYLSLQVSWLPWSLALFPPFVVWAAYTGGIVSAVISACWLSFYSLWVLYPQDIPTGSVVTIGVFATAWFSAKLKQKDRDAQKVLWKAKLVDEINGGIEKLIEMEHDLYSFYQESTMNNKDKDKLLEIHHKAANLVTVISMWHQLYKEKKAVIEQHERDIVESKRKFGI